MPNLKRPVESRQIPGRLTGSLIGPERGAPGRMQYSIPINTKIY